MSVEMKLPPTSRVRPAVIPRQANNSPWFDKPLTVLAVLAIPLLIQITPWWQPTDDAIGYLSLGRAIANGGPLRMLGSRVLHYAIGYPLLLVPAFWLDSLPLLQVFALNFVFAMATAYGVFVWSRRYVGSSAFFVAGLSMWNASYWDLYRQPLSETAFLAALIWGGLACRRLLDTRGTRQIVLMTMLAAVSVIAVSTIRQVGIFLAAGYGLAAIVQAVRRDTSWSRAVLTTLGVGVPASVILVGLLLAYRSMAQGDTDAHTYLDLIIDREMTFTQQLTESVRLRTAEIGRQLVPGFFKAYGRLGQWLNVNTILYVVVSGAVVYGWWKLVRSDYDVLILTAPFYLGVYLLWPFDQGTRFMTPMLPVLWLCVWKLATTWFASANRILAPLMVAHLVQALVYFGLYLVAAQKCHADLQALIELAPTFDDKQTVVCGLGISRQTEMLVNLLTDRRMTTVKIHEIPAESSKWTITENPELSVPGFEMDRRAGRITLYVRRE